MPAITPDSPRSRGAEARALERRARDFVEACADQAEAGAFIAGRDLRRLEILAARLVSDLVFWTGALEDLDLARHARLDPRQAGRLVIESLFDEALTPSACRVLSAAMDLIWLDRDEACAGARANAAQAVSPEQREFDPQSNT